VCIQLEIKVLNIIDARCNREVQVSVVTSSSTKLTIYIVIKRRMKDNLLMIAYNFRFN